MIIIQTLTAVQILLRSPPSFPVPHETNFYNPPISIHLSARSALVRLAGEKVLLPAPESLATAIIFYFHHRLQAILLFSHQSHRFIACLMPSIDAIENP